MGFSFEILTLFQILFQITDFSGRFPHSFEPDFHFDLGNKKSPNSKGWGIG